MEGADPTGRNVSEAQYLANCFGASFGASGHAAHLAPSAIFGGWGVEEGGSARLLLLRGAVFYLSHITLLSFLTQSPLLLSPRAPELRQLCCRKVGSHRQPVISTQCSKNAFPYWLPVTRCFLTGITQKLIRQGVFHPS